MGSEKLGTYVGAAAIVLVVAGVPLTLGLLPRVLGPDGFADRLPLRAPLRWEVQRHAIASSDGRDVLLVDAYGVTRGGSSPDTSVYRLILVDRHTGEILGRHTSFHDLDPVAFHPGRLWVNSTDGFHEALTLPDLEPEASLADILAARNEPSLAAVDDVYFPADAPAVRVLTKDGFLWDVHPDLATVTRLHHDTPVPSTPSLVSLGASGSGGEVTLPSGRIALLGLGSRRPALRVAEQRGALETTEVSTPLDGFLDGSFLSPRYGTPVLRPPEDVFLQHKAEDGVGWLLSRVSASEGLRWTRGEADWLPDGRVEGSTIEVVAVEDRGDRLFLWLERTPKNVYNGADHFLLGIDPESGDALWVTSF